LYGRNRSNLTPSQAPLGGRTTCSASAYLDSDFEGQFRTYQFWPLLAIAGKRRPKDASQGNGQVRGGNVGTALGPGVLQAAEKIQFHLNSYGRCEARLWKDFIEKLYQGAGDEVMGSPLGMAIQPTIQSLVLRPLLSRAFSSPRCRFHCASKGRKCNVPVSLNRIGERFRTRIGGDVLKEAMILMGVEPFMASLAERDQVFLDRWTAILPLPNVVEVRRILVKKESEIRGLVAGLCDG